MAQLPTNKIHKYKLQDRIIALHLADGLTTYEIAEKVSSEIEGDSISQASVARFLKDWKEKRKALEDEAQQETTNVVRAHVKARVHDDMQVLEEVEEFALAVMRNYKVDASGKVVEQYAYHMKDRFSAGMHVIKVIEAKISLASHLAEPDETPKEENEQHGKPLLPSGPGVRSIVKRFGTIAGGRTERSA